MGKRNKGEGREGGDRDGMGSSGYSMHVWGEGRASEECKTVTEKGGGTEIRVNGGGGEGGMAWEGGGSPWGRVWCGSGGDRRAASSGEEQARGHTCGTAEWRVCDHGGRRGPLQLLNGDLTLNVHLTVRYKRPNNVGGCGCVVQYHVHSHWCSEQVSSVIIPLHEKQPTSTHMHPSPRKQPTPTHMRFYR